VNWLANVLDADVFKGSGWDAGAGCAVAGVQLAFCAQQERDDEACAVTKKIINESCFKN
jgi:hypothetical protein